MRVWWLSFATNDAFLGAAIVTGDRLPDAVRRAHVLRCNPGGHVRGFEIPEPEGIPERYCGRLMQREEIEELETIMGTGGRSPVVLTDAEAHRLGAQHMCAKHNDVEKPS